MTEKSKQRFIGVSYSVLGGVVVGIVMLVLQSSLSDTKQFREDLIQIDKTKAEYEYVDDKIKESEKRSRQDYLEIKDDIKAINQKQDRTIELIIEGRSN